jgi:hypothetical protein
MNLYFLIELGKVRCISLFVKSLKECKFMETDEIQTLLFGSTDIIFCPRFTQTSSDLYKSRYTDKLFE